MNEASTMLGTAEDRQNSYQFGIENAFSEGNSLQLSSNSTLHESPPKLLQNHSFEVGPGPQNFSLFMHGPPPGFSKSFQSAGRELAAMREGSFGAPKGSHLKGDGHKSFDQSDIFAG